MTTGHEEAREGGERLVVVRLSRHWVPGLTEGVRGVLLLLVVGVERGVLSVLCHRKGRECGRLSVSLSLSFFFLLPSFLACFYPSCLKATEQIQGMGH